MSETEMIRGAEDAMAATGTRGRKTRRRAVGECHRCPRHGKGDPYCWQVCLGPAEHSDKGRSYVRLGALEAEAEFLADNMADGGYGTGSSWEEQEEAFYGSMDADAADPYGDGGVPIDPDSIPEEQILTPSRTRQTGGDVDTSKPGSGVSRDLSDDVERALVPILANLFGDDSMSDIRLCIFRHVFKGEDLGTIGRTLPKPMSKQAVFKHLRHMVRENPVIGKVIMGMKREGHGGAHKRRSSQMSLFEFEEWQ